MRVCPVCGARLPPGAGSVCQRCGASLETEGSAGLTQRRRAGSEAARSGGTGGAWTGLHQLFGVAAGALLVLAAAAPFLPIDWGAASFPWLGWGVPTLTPEQQIAGQPPSSRPCFPAAAAPPSDRNGWSVFATGSAATPLRPSAVALDGGGAVLVASAESNTIFKFSPNGQLLDEWNPRERTVSAEGDSGVGFRSLAARGSGVVYYLDTDGKRIRRTTTTGDSLAPFGATAEAGALLKQGAGLTLDRSGSVYVTDRATGRLHKYSPSGELLFRLGAEVGSPLRDQQLGAVAVDGDGALYVALTSPDARHRIVKLSAAGKLQAEWGDLPQAEALAVDAAGMLYAATATSRILRISPKGAVLQEWGKPGRAPGEFQEPRGLVIDARGSIYVADTGNCRVQKYTP